jgi:hypothetical protein
LAINIWANCIGQPRDQAGVIGDYLVEYLVLLPWGNREVGRPLRARCGGKWGSGEVGKLSHHPITLSPYLLPPAP